MTDKTLSELLHWRYATKKMDPAKAVPEDKVDAIVEAVRLAPTSSGLQPFELVLVTNADTRARIAKVANDQQQINDGSHLLVFAAWDDYTAERIDEVVDLNVQARGDLPKLREYYDNLKANYLARDAEVNFEHAARQAYIAMGIALVAAAEQEVDSTPMEGFDPDQVDEILDLRARCLRSVVIVPLGYREGAEDWLLPMAKVRKSRDTFVQEVR